ncbi:MAG: efflux RND transporter permease subunit, partial [Balneolales bacterium]
MKITETSLRRPVTSLMIFISLVVIGLISGRMLPLEFFPDITFPGAFVQVPYQNASPEEIEKNITRPIEEVLATLSGIENMNSTSGENQAGIFVQFKMGTDMNMKAIEIREKIDGVRHLMPNDMERYNVFRFSAQDSPVLNLRISSERELSNAYDLLNRNLKLRLERLNGVGQVTMYGVDQQQVRIELIADRLVAHNINMTELVEQLRSANFSLSAGKISDGHMRYNIRPIGELHSAEDIADLYIGDGSIRLSDIATVSYEPPIRDYGRHLDMKYAIGLDVQKESGANTVEVVNLVMNEINEVNNLPEMQGIHIYEMHNQGEGIISSLVDLLSAGVIGAFLSILVLYLFLRQFTTTLIVALAVPFSLIVTLGMLHFLGLSLNILSMMGLMLAVGMLVDNAVVVTENIHSNQQNNPDPKQATLMGVKQVAMAVTAGTLTTIIVFLPNIVSEQSMIAVQLYHVAITIIIALTASLLISLTIIPLLTTRIKAPKKAVKKDWIDKVINRYGRLLNWLMHHKWASGGIIVFTLLSVAIPIKFVEFEMFPRDDQRELMLFFNLNDSYVLENVKESVDIIEEYLYANQEEFDIETVYSYYTSNEAQSTIILKESKKSVEQIKESIEENLPGIAIGQPTFEYQNRNISDQIIVYLIGESIDVLEGLTTETIRRLKEIEGITNVRPEAEMGRDEVQIMVDRVQANRFGLNSREVASTVSGAMRGQNLRRIRGPEGEVDVILAFQNADRQNLDDLRALTVGSAGGETVSLSSLADFNINQSPGTIRRENRETS